MNRIFFIFLIVFPLLALSQNTYVPDDNFEQELINYGYDTVLDDSVLTATAVNETSQQTKQLLKIVDIFGRESKSKKGLLFYIYSDGTVEKKIIVQ